MSLPNLTYFNFFQVRSLYRGITSPLAGVAAMNAICFGVYGNVHRRLHNPDSLQSIGIAGMAAGFVMVRREPLCCNGAGGLTAYGRVGWIPEMGTLMGTEVYVSLMFTIC